uniref:Uncharacterized protein n=1 Tax=Rhizophora mucronata TaxID=61149 RepID=A0A2P2KDT8_RHIMU
MWQIVTDPGSSDPLSRGESYFASHGDNIFSFFKASLAREFCRNLLHVQSKESRNYDNHLNSSFSALQLQFAQYLLC